MGRSRIKCDHCGYVGNYQNSGYKKFCPNCGKDPVGGCLSMIKWLIIAAIIMLLATIFGMS